MKKITSIMVGLLILGSMVLPPRAIAGLPTTPFFGFHGWYQSYLIPGSTYNLEATFSTGTNSICMVDYTLNYPSNIFELQGSPTVEGAFNYAATADYGTPGKVHYVQSALGCYTDTSKAFGVLKLVLIAKTTGTATFSYSNVKVMGGASGEDVISADSSIKDTQYITNQSSPAPSATPTPSSSSSASSNSTSSSNSTPSSSSSSSSTSSSSKSKTATPTPTTKKTATPTPASATNPTSSTTPAPETAIASPAVINISFGDNSANSSTNETRSIFFTGTAEKSSTVKLLIQSNPIEATAQADAEGNWSYELKSSLEDGLHTVTATAEKDGKKSSEVSSQFLVDNNMKKITLGSSVKTTSTTPAVTAPLNNAQKQNSTALVVTLSLILLLGVAAIVFVYLKKKRSAALVDQLSSNANNADFSPVSNLDSNVNLNNQQVTFDQFPAEPTTDQNLVSFQNNTAEPTNIDQDLNLIQQPNGTSDPNYSQIDSANSLPNPNDNPAPAQSSTPIDQIDTNEPVQGNPIPQPEPFRLPETNPKLAVPNQPEIPTSPLNQPNQNSIGNSQNTSQSQKEENNQSLSS